MIIFLVAYFVCFVLCMVLDYHCSERTTKSDVFLFLCCAPFFLIALLAFLVLDKLDSLGEKDIWGRD